MKPEASLASSRLRRPELSGFHQKLGVAVHLILSLNLNRAITKNAFFVHTIALRLASKKPLVQRIAVGGLTPPYLAN